ncbi:MAG: S41 family peptidase, partial [Planctomycetota bacterium]
MKRLKVIMAVLICCGFYVTHLQAESQKAPEGSSIKQQKEAVPELTQTKGQFNPAECFDKIWQIINDEFWDPNFNGVDWEDAKKRYRPRALAAKDHESFAVIINQMLAELKTSHTRYFTKWDPGYYILEVVFGKPDSHRNGIGVVAKRIEGRHYVIAVLNSSSAEKAGIVLGDRLVEVNGQPFHPIRSFENKADQELEIIIQRGPSESTP